MNNSELYNIFDSFIEQEINRKLNFRLDTLLQELLIEYPHAPVSEIINKQRYPVQSVLRLDTEKKKRIFNEIDPDLRCKARTSTETQCRRQKLPDHRYCQRHLNSLPYKDIETPPDPSQKTVKKRGRRGKTKQIDISDLDKSKYIPAVIVTINDKSYLVDQNDIIYNFNSSNEIVGYIEKEQVYWL